MSFSTAGERRDFIMSLRLNKRNRDMVENVEAASQVTGENSPDGQKLKKISAFKTENEAFYAKLKEKYPAVIPEMAVQGSPGQDTVSAMVSRKMHIFQEVRKQMGKLGQTGTDIAKGM